MASFDQMHEHAHQPSIDMHEHAALAVHRAPLGGRLNVAQVAGFFGAVVPGPVQLEQSLRRCRRVAGGPLVAACGGGSRRRCRAPLRRGEVRRDQRVGFFAVLAVDVPPGLALRDL